MSATYAIVLCRGDDTNPANGAISLTDPARAFLEGGRAEDWGRYLSPPRAGDETGVITLPLMLAGATADDAWTNYRAVYAMLAQAARGAGATPSGPRVSLGVQLGGTVMLFYDVVDGDLTPGERAAANRLRATLTLECLPYPRGAPDARAATATITNGAAAASIFVGGVRGDVEALVRLTLTDVSTNGKVIQAVRVGRRSGLGLTSGAYPVALDATATGAGATTTDAGSLGGAFARATLAPGGAFAGVARATHGATAYQSGRTALWARVRDNATPLGQPGALTGAALGQDLRVAQSAVSAPAASSSSVAVSWPRATSDGGLLLAVAHWVNAATPQTVAVAGGGVWSLLASDGAGVANRAALAIYWQQDAAATSGAVTATWSAAATLAGLHILEVAGAAPDNALHAVAVGPKKGDATTPGLQFFTTDSAGQQADIPLAAATEFVLYAFGTDANIASNTNAFGAWNAATETADARGLGVAYRVARASTVVGASNAIPGVSVAVAEINAGLQSLARLGLAFLPDAANPDYALPAGAYQVRVVAVDAAGNRGNASGTTTVVVPSNGSAAQLTWTAPAGAVAYYEVHWDRGNGPRYVVTPGAVTGYTLSREDGAIAEAALPAASGATASPSRLRAVTATASGATPRAYDAVEAGAPGQFRPVRLGVVDDPPALTADDGTTVGGQVTVEAAGGGGPAATLDVDALWRFPADEPSIELAAPAHDLGARRAWVYETRRDLRRRAAWLDPAAGNAEAGAPRVQGRLTLAPGDNLLLVMADVGDAANGVVADVTDCKFTVQITVTPRYRFQTGAP